jgi:O-antigen/teichoic acid export membrane protein
VALAMTVDSHPTRASRRIVFGTLARSGGEAVGKIASLVFFVVVARHLGEEQFGDFVFGMSLSTVLLIVAGLGMQEMIGREVAKDARRADDLVWNVIVLKGLMLVALIVVIIGIVAVQGRSLDSAAAIVIVSVGIGFEYQAGTLYAVFDGRERQQYVATTLIVNRISTALMGVAAALAGASLITIAILFTAGSALGVVTAYWLMQRFVLQPARRIEPHAWRALIKASLPLGILALLGTVSFRTSVVMLGLVSAGTADVGEYGAAFRLIEASLFIAASFNAASLAWFSRQNGDGPVPIHRGFDMASKTVFGLMLPIGLGLALYAQPLIETLYGTDFEGAVTPLRILGALCALWGLNTTMVTVLVTRNRPEVYYRPALIALVPNLALSVILIPAYGAKGAAIAAVAAAALLDLLVVPRTARLLGSKSYARGLAAPLGAGAVMALCAIALGGLPWVASAIVAVIAYAVAFLLIERVFSPGDFAFYASVARLSSDR